jgi:hypothetical protein
LEKKAQDGKRVSGTEVRNAYKLARSAFKVSTAMKNTFIENAKRLAGPSKSVVKRPV